MSHIVCIKAKITDFHSVVAACRRLQLAEPRHGTAMLFGAEATGCIVQFPGWQFPVVIDLASGNIKYDNYNGEWKA